MSCRAARELIREDKIQMLKRDNAIDRTNDKSHESNLDNNMLPHQDI